jgi:hypothetical protein
VGLQDAHAWPELYFEGVGWTRFEPTPSRGSVPDYTQPDLPSPDQPSVPDPRPSDSAEPLPEPSEPEECAPGEGTEDCGAAADPQGGGAAGGGFPAGTVLPAVALVLLAAGIPVLPALWRGRVRARRLDGGGDPGARTLAAWREMTDSAWDLGILPQESATPRTAAARVVRLGRLEGEAAEAAHRLATAVEQALYAPEPRPAQDLAGDVRRVRAGLWEAAGRGGRLRALLLPRSAVRVVWAASERRAAVAGRWGGAARRALSRLRPSRQRV